jgi:hypothetical protein
MCKLLVREGDRVEYGVGFGSMWFGADTRIPS